MPHTFTGNRRSPFSILTFVTVPFVRNCPDYSRGISFLDELADRSGNTEVKKKLVIYANQLKRRWKESEPKAVSHNPRAKRFRRQGKASPSLANVLRIGLLVAATLYFLTHIDLTSLIFPHWNDPQLPMLPPQNQIDSQREETPAPRDTPGQPHEETAAKQLEPGNNGFYTYTDDQGVIHMINDLEKVPQKYRYRMKMVIPGEPRGSATPVIIDGNKVFVPVTLSFHGRSAEAHLLLDTGASITSINGRLASQLGIEASDVQQGKTSVADGRSLRSYLFVADSLTVGSRTMPYIQTSILTGSGGKEFDGLLGMDFLRKFRYHVNFDRSVIEWGG